jgi:hypothetical protein
MSVLACDREGCENIMCDYYSHLYGYLCNRCLLQLIELGVDTDIIEFMDTPPPVTRWAEVDAETYWKSVFREIQQ